MSLRDEFRKYIELKDSDKTLNIRSSKGELKINLDKGFKSYSKEDKMIIHNFYRELSMANGDYFEG